MTRRSGFFVLAGLGMVFFAAAAIEAADWPQWRGANRDGKSAETGLLPEWGKEGPPLAWKADGLGGGDSAAAVAGGRLYGMANRGSEEVVWALSEADGSEVWVTPLGPAFAQRASQGREGPACTPTVDGDRLYVVGLAGNVVCLQAKDGKVLWRRSLMEDFGGSVPMWSYRESPLVDGNKVICTPGGADAVLVALDKLTGETIWKSKLPEAAAGQSAVPPAGGGGFGGRRGGGPGGAGGGSAGYASVIAIELEGQRQYVQLTARGLIGVAASDGKVLWRHDKPVNRNGINCATPISDGGAVFASSAYGAGGVLVKLSKDADGAVKAEEVYATTDMQNHHGGMILIDGYLYGASGGNEGGAIACLDFKTGEMIWDLRREGERRAKGSLAFADGRLYYRMEDGVIVLVEPDPKQYIERGRFEQPNRSRLPAWAHPVIANGRLYVRDQDVLFCYNIKVEE